MKLNERVIIVNVSISEWNGRRFDREVTEEVDNIHNTRRAGVYTKFLIDTAHLAPIVTARGKIRTFHIKKTLPWGDSGDRLLPATSYLDYVKGIQPLIDEFDSLVKDFLDNWGYIKKEGRENLKGLFKEEEYPSVEALKTKFGVRVSKSVLPNTDDIRLDLGSQEMVDQIRSQIEHDLADRHSQAIRDIITRIHTAVKRIVDTLSKEDGKFRNSMIENIENLLEVVPSLNYTNDPRVSEILKKLESLVIDPDHIRSDKDIRKTILDRAKKLEKSLF